MARRDANLAGLAALGALGYKLATAGDKNKSTTGGTRLSEPEAPVEMGDDQYNPDVKQYMDDTINEDVKQRKPAGKKPSAPATPSMMSREQEAKIRATGGPRGTRYLPKQSVTDTGDETERLARRYPAPSVAKPMTREQKIAAIPNEFEGSNRAIGGERVTGNELTRNLDAMLMGRGPTGLTQLGALGAEAATARRAQQAYNARAAARRANEGLSDAEAAAVLRQRALNEMDTTGGAVGYKKGGAAKVKKMASGGMAKEKKPAAKGWGKARGARGAKYY
jgi:hypothetical protein